MAVSIDKPFIISGAGIAGLTAGLALANRGYTVHIVEKREGFDTDGAGIQLSPNAVNVLRELGLEAMIGLVSNEPSEICVRSARSNVVLSRLKLTSGVLRNSNAPYRVIKRSSLHSLLLSKCMKNPFIELHLSTQVIDFATHERGITVMTKTEGKTRTVEYHAAGLLAADGVWSTIRTDLMDQPAPKFAGFIAWRTLVNKSKITDKDLLSRTSVWLSRNSHMVCYPIENSEFLNVVSITREEQPDRNELLRISNEELAGKYKKAASQVKELIDAESYWTGWPIYSVGSVSLMARQSVALLGDAAHPMLPFAAQGGAMAIEDAAVLAASLDRSETVDDAFALYQAKRLGRINRMIRFSEQNGKIYHLSGIFAIFRNIAMFLAPSSFIKWRQNWIYNWRP